MIEKNQLVHWDELRAASNTVAAERIERRRTQNQGVSSLMNSAIPWVLIRYSQSNTTATSFDNEMRMRQLAMADVAFDVLLETGINISLLLV